MSPAPAAPPLVARLVSGASGLVSGVSGLVSGVSGLGLASSFVAGAAMPDTLSPQPLWLVVRDGGIVLRPGHDDLIAPTTEEVAALGLDPREAHHLGRVRDAQGIDQDCLAIDGGGIAPAPGGASPPVTSPPVTSLPALPSPWLAEGLRGLHGRIDDGQLALAGRAAQIVHFAATNRFCGRCGAPTSRAPLEHAMRCSRCGTSGYPRISPAIIVLVRRGHEALLARATRSTSGFYSTLAGFVEPGESLEETVVREVREEVGVEIARLRYFGSQPWPFPHSLMVGFVADYAGGDLVPDGDEIADAAWFAPTALPAIPPKISIARRLIDAWVNEVVGES